MSDTNENQFEEMYVVEGPGEDADSEIESNKKEPDYEQPSQLLVLPVFGRPFMPSQVIPVQLDNKWEETLRQALNTSHKLIALVALPEDVAEDSFDPALCKKMGCLVRIIQARIGQDIQFIAQGLCRVQIDKIKQNNNVMVAKVSYPQPILPQHDSPAGIEIKAYAMSLVSTIKELLPLNPLYFEELRQYLTRFNPSDPSLLADCAASITTCDPADLQNVLETIPLIPRLKLALKLLHNEIAIAKLHREIKDSVSSKLTERQREFFLKEQLKEIQKELGITTDGRSVDVQKFTEKFAKLDAPKHVEERFEEQLNRLKVLEPISPEYGDTRDYLTWLTDIPWGKYKQSKIDISKARKILDSDHEGLKDVKDRIIEFLALGAYKGDVSGSILLFVGDRKSVV